MSTDQTASPVPFSFEVYPPRSDASVHALHDSITHLAAARPRFISVTYGAGGSTAERSLDLLRHILRHTDVEPMAHLTCVGSTYQDADALVREFLDAGVRSFLALRGDPPAGLSEDDAFLGDLRSAAELVQFIGRVRAERASADPGHAQTARGAQASEVDLAVAAFPNGHPRSRHANEHIEALLAKQAAGATMAITQLFFHADDYLSFVERSRTAGVTIPILPGIMPVISPRRLERVLELTGEARPRDLAASLEAEPTAEGQRLAGIRHAADLAREVVGGGAPGVHLYAFNSHETVLDVLRSAELLADEPRLQSVA